MRVLFLISVLVVVLHDLGGKRDAGAQEEKRKGQAWKE